MEDAPARRAVGAGRNLNLRRVAGVYLLDVPLGHVRGDPQGRKIGDHEERRGGIVAELSGRRDERQDLPPERRADHERRLEVVRIDAEEP